MSDLESEEGRMFQRPSEEPGFLLGVFIVSPLRESDRYAARLRELISAAVNIARSADFERDDVSTTQLPEWFVNISVRDDNPGPGDALSAKGRQRYLESRGDGAWDVEEWIYCFDPDLRRWSWWDVTLRSDGRLNVWVDTNGEGHIPCGELWWALYVVGARNVEPLTLEYASMWVLEDSVAADG